MSAIEVMTSHRKLMWPGRYLGEDQSSIAHFDTIEQWVRECRIEHPTCCRTASGRVEIDPTDVDLPTRCIEITKKHIKLKERESHTVGWRGKYIALSHRWTDDTEDSKTTTQNVKDRKQGLRLNNLPKVFEDAIEVARRLSIPYLWVDSLCIIQSGDNGDDWKREARKMASYYQQAYVLLAGTAASKDDGLFIPRFHNHPTNVAYRDKAGVRRGYLYVSSGEVSATAEYHNGVRNAELMERGWIFQVWVLSRRLLWYTLFGVFFECQTLLPRNTDQESIYTDVTESGFDVALTMNIRTKFNSSNAKPVQLWYQIIEVYSKLKLKYPQKDRILAMQGVATEFRDMVMENQRKATPDTVVQDANSPPLYVAGLWLHDIHYGLLWQQKSVAPASKKLSSLPSWSWASRLSEVFWPSFPDPARPPTNACLLIGVVIEGISYPIETNSNALLEIAHLCDVDRASAGLLVSGRLQPVMIRDFLKTAQVLDRMSKSTGDVDTSHLPARETCRAVYSLSSTDFVSGWGSFEDEDIQARLDTLPDAGTRGCAGSVRTTLIMH
jgi:hypothetical protein